MEWVLRPGSHKDIIRSKERPRDHFARNKTPARNSDRRVVVVVVAGLPDPRGRAVAAVAAASSVFLGTVDFELAAAARARPYRQLSAASPPP